VYSRIGFSRSARLIDVSRSMFEEEMYLQVSLFILNTELPVRPFLPGLVASSGFTSLVFFKFEILYHIKFEFTVINTVSIFFTNF